MTLWELQSQRDSDHDKEIRALEEHIMDENRKALFYNIAIMLLALVVFVFVWVVTP